MLVERRHFDIGAKPDGAPVRRVAPGQHLDQRGLAGTVGSDDADTVAALHADREVIDDLAIAIGSADALGFDDQLAGFVGFSGRQVGISGGAAIIAPLLAQCIEIAEPLDVALAAAGNAVAQPMFFVDDLAVELVLVALFFRQHLVSPGLEGASTRASAARRASPPDTCAGSSSP